MEKYIKQDEILGDRNRYSKIVTEYIRNTRNYHCSFCRDCWFRDEFTTSKYERTLSVNTLLEGHKRVVRENLNSENFPTIYFYF